MHAPSYAYNVYISLVFSQSSNADLCLCMGIIYTGRTIERERATIKPNCNICPSYLIDKQIMTMKLLRAALY